jgi:hypothetical protein
MQFSESLSAPAQSTYSDLLGVVCDDELSRSIEQLSGTFNKKTVRGAVYWYFQYTDVAAAKQRQLFVGPDSPDVRALVERAGKKPKGDLAALVKAAIALGCESSTSIHFKIVRQLDEIGFFRAGGLLFGTHAFLTYGNYLGAKWGTAGQTQDVDFAHAGTEVHLALPATLEIKTWSAIEALAEGFLPALRGGAWDDEPIPTATFVTRRDRALKIDFLTPAKPGARASVFKHEQLGVNLQPIEFLEFVLEDVTLTALLGPSGAVLVNVPAPARYALHKLLVHVKRGEREKAPKDLRQAAALLEVLGPGAELKALWRDLASRGDAWKKAAVSGREKLKHLAATLPALKSLA